MHHAGAVIRYYVTDSTALGGGEALVRNVALLGARVDWIQVREKDLSARELADLVRRILEVRAPGVRVLVNGRADIALACGADGVHLPSGSIAPKTIRRLAPSGWLIGVSCHDVNEVRRASDEGADFVVFGPVFETPGKGPATGLEPLQQATQSVRIPVLALGGVTEERWPELRAAGAAGIGGIRLFQSPR
jgi:thiamine-phosphate pyrophosphorylase